MAPKKPPAPPKGAAAPPPKGAPPPPPPPAPEQSGMTPQKLKTIWMCIVGTVLVFGTIAGVMGHLYKKMQAEEEHPLEQPVSRLRGSMAASYRRPKLNYGNAIKVAEEVKTLPDHLDEAEKNYRKRKLKYQTFFLKGGKSPGSWDAFGRNLYYISKGKKSWYDAENFCESRNAHLASILTDEEQNFVTSLLSDPTWIGLTDETEEGKWEWTDGSQFEKQYWSHKQPAYRRHNGVVEQDCVSIVPTSNNYNWNDAYCHEQHRWVCKENLDIEEL
ncbi:asialoglycoprotein receptor 1-like [Zootoca vivipara]|uniref:asialoglycoprotein receptor 1-like n=1 Tax=Zootoca vivipara TaxID=8524 RepID=UPI00293B8A56|nr:asialoglycoprotein receptor 1-like [Zootoca vivipara]